MRWQGNRQSENVEDRRGAKGPVMVGGGIGAVVLVLLVLVFGGPKAALQLINQLPQGGAAAPGVPGAAPEANDETTQFIRTVLADTEDVWAEQFRKVGKQYEPTTLVLFAGEVESRCGFASAAVGPFYCPADGKVYLDTQFFRELEVRFQAPGEFAEAYVIAHEIGHHVQNQLGWSDQIHALQQRADKIEANQLSVRLELQADYLAGVWAHHAQKARNILEQGDVEAAMKAAEKIGDDALQRAAGRRVVPDSFTHGTSAQRARWFRLGLERGDLSGAMQILDLTYSQL